MIGRPKTGTTDTETTKSPRRKPGGARNQHPAYRALRKRVRQKLIEKKKEANKTSSDENKTRATTKQFTNFKRKADRQSKGWSYAQFGKRFGSK